MSLHDNLRSSYLNWINQNIVMRDIDDAIEITTPLMDRHNDYLQIFALRNGDKLRLTDDGYIISDLLMSGTDVLSSQRRKDILQVILNRHGVHLSDKNELYVDASIETFPQKKHLLVQAMMAVNDMFMLANRTVQSVFYDDVANYLMAHDIRFTSNVSFVGKSGFPHNFDFVIPPSPAKKAPERVIRTVNNPDRNSSQLILFSWDDTKITRQSGAKLYVFLNDNVKPVSSDVLGAFSQYQVNAVLWSQRNNVVPELSA